MPGLRVLFLGGTGIISSACSRLAVERGIELFVLNRGQSTDRPLPPEATVLRGDARDPASVRDALGGREFDAVVDWVAYTPGHVRADIDTLPRPHRAVRVHQLRVGVPDPAVPGPGDSSPRRYATRTCSTPGTRSPARNCCRAAYRDEGFPATIVRPVAHLRQDERAAARRLDGPGPDAPGQAGRGARRRHLAVDADPPRGLRAGLRAAARAPAHPRRELPHHLRRRAHLGPDHACPGGRRRD